VRASFDGAKMDSANMGHTRLSGANFKKAELVNADFIGAFATDANFFGATGNDKLTGAFLCKTTMPNGEVAGGSC